MDFFRLIPEEVIVDNLLPYFQDVNDLLRLRRVCQLAKTLVDDYMNLRGIRSGRHISVKLRHIVLMGQVGFETFKSTQDVNWSGRGDTKVGGAVSKLVSIKEAGIDGTLGALLKIGFLPSVENVFLDACCMHDLWKNPQMPEFMEAYASQITKLRLNKFDLPIVQEKKQFIGAFINLSSLEIKELTAAEGASYHDLKSCDESFTFPNLKDLKIHQFTVPDRQTPRDLDELVNYYKRLCGFIKSCCSNEKMEYLDYPGHLHISDARERTGSRIFFMIQEYLSFTSEILETRRNIFPCNSNYLKLLDLRNFWIPGPSRENMLKFLDFGSVCKRNGVKLMNFDQTLFQTLCRSANEQRMYSIFGELLINCVVSLRNIHFLAVIAELPHLERILINRTSLCSMQNVRLPSRPLWPKLTTIHLIVDSEELGLDGWPNELQQQALSTFALFDLLFGGGIRREAMTELKIKFTMQRTTGLIPLPICPTAHVITTSCANLKILALEKWPAGNVELARLWTGLLLLEEISLINCTSLDLSAFTGGHRGSYANFLRLKGLKKLSLNHIENMPHIKDSLFSIVLRHMELKELHLTSDRPITNITLGGIGSLLTGNFSRSIERFPIVGSLKMNGVSEQEMKIMECKFRSSKMI